MTEWTMCDGDDCRVLLSQKEKYYVDENGRRLCYDCMLSYLNGWFEELSLCDKLHVFEWELDDFQTIEAAETNADRTWVELPDKEIIDIGKQWDIIEEKEVEIE
jgi:hypothetical protein